MEYHYVLSDNIYVEMERILAHVTILLGLDLMTTALTLYLINGWNKLVKSLLLITRCQRESGSKGNSNSHLPTREMFLDAKLPIPSPPPPHPHTHKTKQPNPSKV